MKTLLSFASRSLASLTRRGARGVSLRPRRAAALRAALAVPGLLLATFLLLSAPTLAAETCPNEARRAEDPYSQALPDCRAYEQVSPVEKSVADVDGWVESVRVVPSGEALTFNSTAAFPGGEGQAQIYATYVATRGAAGWSSRNMEGPNDPGTTGSTAVGVTEDLQQLIVGSENRPPLRPEDVEGVAGAYMRDSATGTYQLLASGEAEGLYLVAATDGDSRIFFESSHQLLPQAPPEKERLYNLYEWHEGRLSLIDVLPGGAVPAMGASAGPRGGAHEHLLTAGAVSEAGSRVFFTDTETGRLYAREPQAHPAVTIAVSQGPAEWRAATPDGSQVIYSEGEGADANLYRFTVAGERREALTSGAAGVLGVMGIGGDGAYVYFAAEGVLAPGARAGAGNLYLYHEGRISFIADEGRSNLAHNPKLGELLEPEDAEAVWTAGNVYSAERRGPAEGQRSASVSADGTTLVFTSPASLTGYENAEHLEVYLYSAASGHLTCVSCNPSGRPASDDAILYLHTNNIFAGPPELAPTREPRFLSEDGLRVFFETEEALLPGDVNGEMDVYEWEREGAGSCPAGGGEGCLYLISSGTSTEPSVFAGASASGNDVFFFTRQALVGQDTDALLDLYDARVGGGLAAQNPSASVAPCQGEACRPAQTPAPAVGVPASQLFSGPGNLAPPAESKSATQLKPKPLTRAQEIANALKACRKKPNKKRAACESLARKKYGIKVTKTGKFVRAGKSVAGGHS
jgi:hypothetical protein